MGIFCKLKPTTDCATVSVSSNQPERLDCDSFQLKNVSEACSDNQSWFRATISSAQKQMC